MRASTLVSTLAVAVPAVLGQDSSSTTSPTSSMSMSSTTSSASSMSSSSGTSNSTSMSACDKYAMALFKANNATTQYTLLTALVNTAVIGNYTKDPAPMNAVTGILNNGTYQGRPVSLLKYFDGMLASSNRGGSEGVAVNFLDGGGATPLTMNKPANGTDSNQYFLLTHLYEYFGALLGCSAYGSTGFPAYTGDKSQYQVHKFMDLSHDEVSYFIQEVGLAATSFGVSADDAMAVGKKLDAVFNYKCLPEATVIPAQGPALQSICSADDCPQAQNASCAAYQSNITMPVAANDTNMYTMKPSGTAVAGGSGSGSGSGSASETSSSATTDTSGIAAANTMGAVFMGVAGLAALAAGL